MHDVFDRVATMSSTNLRISRCGEPSPWAQPVGADGLAEIAHVSARPNLLSRRAVDRGTVASARRNVS
jgi:hypothetical protein